MKTIFANRACGVLYGFIKQCSGCYILPANVCPVVPLTFRLASVDFRFVDINPQTLCVDEQACLDLIRNGECQGLVFVHTYGTSYNPQLFFGQLKEMSSSVYVIDDKCLCFPEMYVPETEADLTLYSTGYAKCVDLGIGGYGYVKDCYDMVSELLPYNGMDIDSFYKKAFRKGEKIGEVPKGWLNPLLSEGLAVEYVDDIVSKLDEISEQKNKINAIYSDVLKGVSHLGDDFNQWRYNILVDNKEELLKLLFENGLFASSHYQPSSKLFVDDSFPNAEKLYGCVINLFNDRYIDCKSAKKIADLIKDGASCSVDSDDLIQLKK